MDDRVAEPDRWQAVRRWAAAVVAAALIALGVLAAPLGVVAAHARQQIVHTDTFVAAYGPLARDPQVQALVVDAVTAGFAEWDLPGLIDRAAAGVAGLGLPDRVAEAIGRIDGAGIEAQVASITRQVVASDVFADVWEQALRATHAGARSVLGGGGVVSVDDAGTVRLELGAVVAEVRARLIDSGWWLAWLIPEVDRSVVVAEVPALAAVLRTTARVDTAGTWLPVLAVVAVGVGVALARRRRRATALAMTGVAVAMGLLAAGVVLGRGLVVAAVSDVGTRLTEPTTAALYDAATAGASGTAVGLGALAALVAAVAGYAAFRESRRD